MLAILTAEVFCDNRLFLSFLNMMVGVGRTLVLRKDQNSELRRN